MEAWLIFYPISPFYRRIMAVSLTTRKLLIIYNRTGSITVSLGSNSISKGYEDCQRVTCRYPDKSGHQCGPMGQRFASPSLRHNHTNFMHFHKHWIKIDSHSPFAYRDDKSTSSGIVKSLARHVINGVRHLFEVGKPDTVRNV